MASAAAAPAFELASLESKPVTLAERPRTVPKIETAPKAEVASEKPVTAFAPVPAPPAEKPKRALAPPASTGQFDESQIPGFKSRLRLTPEQAEYWPAIEAALRDVLRHLAREARKHGGTPRIDVHSAEVQRLVSAAMPLLMSMREDQKREVRQLARVIGLEQVAAAI